MVPAAPASATPMEERSVRPAPPRRSIRDSIQRQMTHATTTKGSTTKHTTWVLITVKHRAKANRSLPR